MPDAFSSDIRDLISKMLCVNVCDRITIEQIKAHQAFRSRLPPTYIVPSPIPVVAWARRIPSDAIKDQYIRVLRHIGYDSDQVIIEELTSSTHSMAKVFYAMCEGTAALQNLPWQQTNSTRSPYGLPNEAFDGSAQIGDFNPEDPFHRRPRLEDISPPPTSFSPAERPSWAPVFTQPGLQIRQTIEGIPAPVEALFNLLQLALSRLGYEYFHPNQLQIIARSSDMEQYLSLNVEFVGPESMKLIVSASQDIDGQIGEALANIVGDLRGGAEL
jgi:serine/threonine protein kinase